MLVVGDLMLDRYVSGRVTRISPESPVPVVQVEKKWAGVGGAANVAANVVALGAQCDVVGCVGKDDAGRELRERLDELGVGAVRLLREKAHRGLAGCASVVLQDYDKGVLVPEVIQEVLDGARAEGAPAIVDPKRRRFFGYGSATVFKPNARELEDALGEPVRPEDGVWMEGARSRLDCEHLLLTLGGRGMALCSARNGTTLFPASDRAVFDVSGAGDTVTAVVSVSVALGASMSEAAVIANHAAAVQVSKAGVATVTREELYEHASILMAAREVGGTKES